MKIEVGESLACSYLRHVKGCWLVQTNWKTPEHWGERQPDAVRFSDLKRRFDRDGAVFKKTKDAAQFLKQGEIDVVGVDLQGNVHAMEVAFHEAGLNYGHTADETYNRVLKKMLRVVFILNRLIHPPQTALHAYFLSPKVNPAVEGRLKEMFNDLLPREPGVVWQLMINADCTDSVVKPTLESASSVADSSELFLRSVKLLETANGLRTRAPDTPAQTSSRRPGPAADPRPAPNDGPRRPEDALRKIKTESHRSWSDLRKAVRALLDQPHEPFGTPNVENSSKNTIRRMRRETGLEFDCLKVMLDSM